MLVLSEALMNVLAVPCCRLLDTDNPVPVLDSGLQLFSNLAHLSQVYYEPLAVADICGLARPLLEHPVGVVRQKACHLIGNLCRHNAKLYPALRKAEVLPVLIERCRDPDVVTRRGASFAIGNTGAKLACIWIVTRLLQMSLGSRESSLQASPSPCHMCPFIEAAIAHRYSKLA